MQRNNPARRLHERLWFSLGLFAGLIVLHQFLIQPALIQMTSDAPAINLAGRQRMLSQKLTKSALAAIAATEQSESDQHRKELAETLETWRLSHANLRNNRRRTLFDHAANEAIPTRFAEIEPHFQAIVDASEALLATEDQVTGREALKIIMEHEPEFLTRMHALVGLYEGEARQHVQQLQALGLTIMAMILGVQLMIQFGLLRPELKTVGREWEKIEADYELLVESMTDGLVAFGRNGQVEFASKRFCDMIGRSVNQVVQQPAELFVVAKQQREFQKLLDDDHHASGPIDFQLCRADGSRVDVIVSPQRMRDTHGNIQGSLLVVTDITARKSIEQRSRDLQIQLTHADRLKSMGAMAAALAHEINQPLGAISNYAEGCLSRISDSLKDPAELMSPLRGILRAAHRGAEIVRRTKDFSRKQPHQKSVESINDLIHEVAELCSPEARQRGISLDLNLAKNLPSIHVDGIQIQQVVINLIQNAFQALKSVEHLRRSITLTTRCLPDDEIEVSVADSGPGIPTRNCESVFEPFVSSGEGTGLGLAIAREIVEAHEGRIWNEAPINGGAIFLFTLPLVTTPEPLIEPLNFKEGANVG